MLNIVLTCSFHLLQTNICFYYLANYNSFLTLRTKYFYMVESFPSLVLEELWIVLIWLYSLDYQTNNVDFSHTKQLSRNFDESPALPGYMAIESCTSLLYALSPFTFSKILPQGMFWLDESGDEGVKVDQFCALKAFTQVKVAPKIV